MGKRGKFALLGVFLLLLLSMSSLNVVAADYVANVQVAVEKSLYGPNEEMRVSVIVLLSNRSSTNTGFLPVANATINFTISNSSGLQAQYLLNASSDGTSKSRSDLFPAGIIVNAPAADGYYNLTAVYLDPNGVAWKAGGAIRVFSSSVDYVSISPAEARYYAGETVIITLRALKEAGDRKVALPQVTINGSMRYTNRTVISTFSCVTESGGACTTSVTAPAKTGTYLLEANNFLSTSSFVVVPFEAFVYVKDSTGESFKEIFKANELATIEVNVKSNGTLPTGNFVFNGTITNSNSQVIANITSTTLESNNSYTNRFSFTISNAFANGVYYVSVTVYKTGTSNRVSASTSFQVRSWSLAVAKASENSGFEYEYTAFQNKNVSFEIYPKEYQNGTVITDLNSTLFNITLNGKTGTTLGIGNATWNASCSSSGCYTFSITMPSAAGRYVLSVSLNYSSEVQTAHRIISVTSTSLSTTPTNQDRLLKELFGTTESVYVSLTAKNQTSSVNITDVLVESVVYENGTKFNFTEVASWSNVSSNNSVLEWAWNITAQRIKLDAPKVGGNYLITVFANNRSVAASTKFAINPYTVCSSAKSTAGSVDSSSGFYVWQYKTTDTVYFELKVSQAQNGLGRAAAGNSSTFSSSNYGMGSACYFDTTKTQAITNSTITVESVVNLQSGAKIAINTTASTCSADDNSGTYTCTVKPETKWNGGRYSVKMKVTGPDSETVDMAEAIFEARAFYMWAYSDSWTNKPASNITFNVQMYEAGTNWWSNYGSTGGITGEVAIQKVEYNGKDGEWLWPPLDISYNTTGLNASNITNGRGTFRLETPRLPKGMWEPGYYFVTIKGTNTATGESDYGQAWFGIKQWDAYSTPVDQSGSSYTYKDSFSTKENVTLFVRITNAGDWNDNGGTNLAGGEKITVGVKKLQYYTRWPPTDLNSTSYTVQPINVSTSSPWYWNANPNSHSKYVINISPTSGRWDGGYYSIILDVNGTETGYGWFNVIAFSIDTQPVNASGTYTYTSKGNGPVYFNITTTKNKKSLYSYYSTNDYINTTVKDLVLRLWREDTWKTEEFNYPEDLNISPLRVNGTALLMVNKTGNWPGGYYWGEITMQDSENSTGNGYLWFSVRSFRVETSVSNYTIDSDANVSVTLNIRQPDWSNNNLVLGNYTVMQVYEDVWSGSGRSRTSYTNYRPSSSEWFNATTKLNITPSGTWSSANGGYHYLNIVVRDNNDNTTQNGWVSFRSVPYSISVGSVQSQYSVSQSSNITVPVTVTKATSGAPTPANLSRAFEYTYPTQTEYGFAVGNCTSAVNGTACQVSGTQNVTLIPPSGGWPSGYHYLYLEFVSPNGANKVQADNSAWFNAVQAYDGYFSNYDEGGYWKYNFGFNENITIRIYVRNTNYVPQEVNITKVEMSEDGDNCWSDYCKVYSNYSYQVLNGSGGTGIAGNGTIRIIKPAAQWKRGQHSIKATIQGSAGNAVIKTGYVYVKDTSAPNITVISPTNGQVFNTSTLVLFNATSNENVQCSLTILNFDQFASSWYCSGVSNGTNAADAAVCNSSRFKGSTNFYQYVSSAYGLMNTGGLIHYSTITTEGWTNQDYGIHAWCDDVDWNNGFGKVTFTLNTSAAARPVTVNLSSPANAATVNSSTVNFKYNVTGPSGSAANCSVYVNVSSIWRANVSNTVSLTSGTNATTVNVAGFNDGAYMWNAYCFHTTNITNAAWAASNFTFTVANNLTSSNASNTTSVLVNLSSPANSATISAATSFVYNATGAASLNCTVWGNFTGTWAANLTNNSVSAGRVESEPLNVAAGSYKWNAQCINATNSTIYGWGISNWTFTVANNVTLTPVSVNLSSPANNAVINTSWVTFGYNASGPSAGMTCALWSNSTGIWKANLTNSSATPGQQTANHTNFVNGTYVWNSRCEDNSNSSNYAWAASNRTLVVTNITGPSPAPASNITINLSSPANSATISAATSFVYNATGAASLNCTVWGNFTGTWAANLTNNSVSAGRVESEPLNVAAGSYKWNAQCINATDSTLYGWGLLNWTFTRS